MSKKIFCAAIAALLLASSPASAGGDHDHGEGAHAPVASAQPRAEAHSDAFEAVLVAKHGTLTLYLDRYATGDPVDGAAVDVITQDGSVRAAFVADGTYTVDAPWADRPGRTEITLAISAGAASDLLVLSLVIPDHEVSQAQAGADLLQLGAVAGGALVLGMLIMALISRRQRAAAAWLAAALLIVPAERAWAGPGHDHGEAGDDPAQAVDIPRRLTDGTLFIPKATQRLLKVRTLLTEWGEHRPSILLPGHVIADPNRSGVVASTTGGRLLPPQTGFPRLGATVSQGDVLALVEPPLTAIDASDIRQRRADLDKEIDLVRAKLDRLRRAGTGVPRAQIEDAEIELKGLIEARAQIERGGQPSETLRAPVSGVIGRAAVGSGRVVAAGDVLFTVIDPGALWIEALAFDPRLAAGVTTATARASGGALLQLEFRGAGLSALNQGVPVQFAILDPPPGLRTDMPATVFISLDTPKTGVAIPAAALVRGLSGQAVVYVQIGAERFEPRAVAAEPLDAARLLVTNGLGAGARVIVAGAELVNQTR